MRVGLIGRLVIGGLVIAVFFLVQLVLSTRSLDTIRRSTQQEQSAERAIVSAIRIEQFVIDLSAGTRGFVITGNPQFLQSWNVARRRLPTESARLMQLVPGAETREISASWRSYLNGYSIPIIRIARVSPAKARARVATLEGLRRIARVRGLIDPFVTRQNAAVTRDRERVASSEHNAKVVAFVGAGIRIALFAAVLTYLLRSLIVPLRRVALATGELAAGRLGVEVPEGGAGEVGELARSFNEMSRSVGAAQRTLAEQNVDLERLANVLRAILDSTVDGILLSDADGNVQLANRPVINLTRDLGMNFDGTVVDRLLSVEHRIKDPEAYRAAMERLRTNPSEPTFDEFEDALSGRVFQGFTSPVLDDRGGFLGRIWTLRDVTQQRELDRLKDDFVATVSHELRTPLTSMMGFLEMIREGEAGDLNAEQQRFLSIVYRSSERLQRLVGDLLFVARLDASGLQLQFADVDVAEVVAEAVESAGALARSRELALHAEVQPVPPVHADRERLTQLLSNLLSNAVKFTPAGGEVSARVFPDGDDVVVEVEDTGIGIPAAEQERLFQRFFRSSTATEQAIPGTGLGLVISKAIAEAHGGRIGVRSSAGAGTCFSVRLPRAGIRQTDAP
jgi:signal transduction histidine kinase